MFKIDGLEGIQRELENELRRKLADVRSRIAGISCPVHGASTGVDVRTVATGELSGIEGACCPAFEEQIKNVFDGLP